MEIVVRSKKSVSSKIVPLQQEFPTQECDVKNYLTGHPEPDKKIRLHPNTSDSATLVTNLILIFLTKYWGAVMFPPVRISLLNMFLVF